jgi:hypothetical protein
MPHASPLRQGRYVIDCFVDKVWQNIVSIMSERCRDTLELVSDLAHVSGCRRREFGSLKNSNDRFVLLSRVGFLFVVHWQLRSSPHLNFDNDA